MTRENITSSAHGFQISSVLPFCDVFSFKLLSSKNVISLAIGMVGTWKFFKGSGSYDFVFLLVLINTKVHSKSCYYLY